MLSWKPKEDLIDKTMRRDTSKDDIMGLLSNPYCRSIDNDESKSRREY
jgi:hypothetical protein